PYFNMVERGEGEVVRLVKPVPAGGVRRRQDAPVCFDMNASIYVWRRDALIGGGDTVFHDDTLLFEMPEERSHDIDTELDFDIVAFMAAKRGSLL
ncbi:MAG: flagellar modification protein B, partial [Nitrospinae bacterium]|nr:flagellar modification protein B [Nitrospinota bacterium]